MINRFSKTILLALVTVFLVAGCEQGYEKEGIANESEIGTNVVLPGYASRAIEAAGGRRAWMETKKLQLDCVVTFYKSDGSFYLTQQRHEIYPWLDAIRISAQEPQGKFVWQLTPDKFSVLQGAGQIDALPIENRYFAEAILDLITAPIRVLDKSFKFIEGTRPVKRQGLWYYPIERVPMVSIGIEQDWSKVVFYQNTDSSLVDMLWFVPIDTIGVDSSVIASEAQPSVAIPISLMVRGYDYRNVKKRGVCIPTKIEIFRTNAMGVLQQRLVEIEYYSLTQAPPGAGLSSTE